MSKEPIKIEGLKEFNKKLKQLDAGLPKMTRLALNKVTDVTVDETKPKVANRSGAAMRSLRSSSTQTQARITAGGRRAPYYPWLDFGGRVGRNKSVNRRFKRDGRYIFPAYKRLKNSGEIESILSKALTQVANEAGFEVT